MKYSLSVLPNGLRVLSVPMPQLESATVTVWVKTGSRMENSKVNGISHFLEHMVFKGSKKRPSAKEISEAVDAIGGEFNANTNKDWTNFYIKARATHLETAFDVLADMVLNPILAKEEIEREKGVIVEEIRMYEDTPMVKISDVFEGLTFSGSSLGWDIAGNEKTVRGIEKTDFLRYRKMHYHPKNMLITVSGAIKEKDILSLAKRYFGGLNGQNSKVLDIEPFKVSQDKPRVKLRTKKIEQAHFILGFLGNGRSYPGKFAEMMLTTILGGGMSSRLFIEVRERRGLAYAVKTWPDRYQDVGYIGNYAGVDVARVDEAISVILEQLYGLASKKFPITKKELLIAKEYLKGHLALALEDTKDVSGFFGEQAIFLKEVLTPEEVFAKVDRVTADEVVGEAKKLFVPQKLNLAIIGPYDDDERFRKLI